MLRNGFGHVGLVRRLHTVPAAREPHREGLRLNLQFCRDRHQQTGVDPAGQKEAQRDVGDHLAADGPPQDVIKIVQRCNSGWRRQRLRLESLDTPRCRGNTQAAAGRKLADTLQQSERRRGPAERQILRNRAGIDSRGVAQRPERRQDAAQLRCEHDGAVGFRHIERLYTDRIDGERDHLATTGLRHLRVGIHAVELAIEVLPVQDMTGQHHFGVGPRAEHPAPGRQIGFEILKVVELAVEHQDWPVLGRDHRLCAAFDVDDGQPQMAQGDALADINPLAVRPPMLHGRHHRPDNRLGRAFVYRGVGPPDHAAYSAHSACSQKFGQARAPAIRG